MRTLHLAGLMALAVIACACGPGAVSKRTDETPKVGPPAYATLATLAELMTGSFSSAAQSAADEDYFDIRLEMARIWPDRKDGYWLYVEQAAASNLERPYRQRVYHVEEDKDGSFRSEVYSIPDPLRFVGDWKKKDPLVGLSRDSLEIREGCAVILRLNPDGLFAGGTDDAACKSTLRGASYATSDVVVGEDRIESWDRGFDATGNQVWGAEKGPYIFNRN